MICVQVYFITKCSGFAAQTNKNPCALAHGQFQISPQKTLWSVLCTATKNADLSGDTILEKSVLERIFAFARTYFSKVPTEVKPQWQPKDNLWNAPRTERKRGK